MNDEELDWIKARLTALEEICGALGVPAEYMSYIGAQSFPDPPRYEFKLISSASVTGEQADRFLSRLRYPPRGPAKGSVSRRREKLKKAGIR